MGSSSSKETTQQTQQQAELKQKITFWGCVAVVAFFLLLWLWVKYGEYKESKISGRPFYWIE
jgi:hypothetical protein